MTTTTLSASAVRTQRILGGGSLGEDTSGQLEAGDNGLGASWSAIKFDLPAGLAGGTINEAKLLMSVGFSSDYGDMGRTVIGVPANNTPIDSLNVPGSTLGTNVRYIADNNYAGYGYSDYDYVCSSSIPSLEINVLAMMQEAQAAGRYNGNASHFIWRLMNRVFGSGYGTYYHTSASAQLYLDYTPANLWVTGGAAIRVGQVQSLTVNRIGTSGALVVNLSQSSGSVLSIPSTVTIADGASSQAFNVTGAAAGTSTITANDGTNTATVAIDVVDLSTNLISLWHLDEASGDATDSWGSNTLTGNASPGSTAGKFSNCRTFTSGSSQYFSKASNASLITGNIDFTFSGWVYLSSVPSNNDAYSLFTKDSDSPASSRDYTIDFFRNDSSPSAGGFRFYLNGGGGGAPIVSTGYTGYSTTGQWYHLIAWHDAAADTINIQVDGTVFTANTSGTVPQTGSGQFRLGARQYTGFNNPLNGRLDEVAFWKRKLTTTERAYLFNSGAGNLVTDLAPPSASQSRIRINNSLINHSRINIGLTR